MNVDECSCNAKKRTNVDECSCDVKKRTNVGKTITQCEKGMNIGKMLMRNVDDDTCYRLLHLRGEERGTCAFPERN